MDKEDKAANMNGTGDLLILISRARTLGLVLRVGGWATLRFPMSRVVGAGY